MSAIIPNIPPYANRSPNSLQIHTDSSLGSAFELAGDSTAYDYGHVGVPMNQATNAVLATTVQPENILKFHCEVCNISCYTKEVLDAHKRGKKHLKSAQKLAEPSASAPQVLPPQMVSPQSVASETLLGDLENKKLRLLQNGATPETMLLCEICNVICNNQDGFQMHIASKKHAAKAIIQQANPNAVFDATSSSSTALPKKLDTFPCEICKITCTSHELLKMHIAGKKHLKKVKDLGHIPNLPLTPIASQDTPPINPVGIPESVEDKTVNLPLTPIVSQGAPPNLVVKSESDEDKTINLPTTPIVSTVAPPTNLVKSEPIEDETVKMPLTPIVSQVAPPTNVVVESEFSEDKTVNFPVVNSESNAVSNEGKTVNLHGTKSVCELCGISCDTEEVLKIHLTGKKHKKNLEKSERLIGPKPALTAESAETPTLIGPVKQEGEMANSSARKRKAGKGGGDEDVEVKKKRVLQSGAASDAVQICTLCNVVCNSSKVYFSHLAGQKHASMAVKQAESQAGATSQQS